MTKEDMLDFFRFYFLPNSPSRAKVSVHLVAQASADDIAAKVDPAEQKQKLAGTLAQVLSQLGVEIDVGTLANKLDKVDVTGGDTKGILAAVGGYLKENASMAAEQVEQVMEQGEAVLAQILPSLGIRSGPPPKTNGVDGDATPENKAVVIEDVKAFKDTMPLSAAPRPIKELSEFEELEPKL